MQLGSASCLHGRTSCRRGRGCTVLLRGEPLCRHHHVLLASVCRRQLGGLGGPGGGPGGRGIFNVGKASVSSSAVW